MRHVKSILAIWGAISGLLLLCALAFITYNFTFGNKPKHDVATIEDVRFVLNWPDLGDERITSVLHSYESARSLTGDHIDAYEILTSNISVQELQNSKNWMRGDTLDGVLREGVELVRMFSDVQKLPWFPSDEALTSEKIYVYSWSVLFHGNRATSAQLIFAKPSENTIYYASVKS